jgi:CRISPR-associated Csx14 family protein
MKNSLIAVLGLSPPVITEFVKYMVEGEGLRVTDLTVVFTEEKRVLNGLRLVEAALKDRYPRIRFHEWRLPFEDVTSVEETYAFMELIGRVLYRQRAVHKVDSVHLCLAGGRKDMGITAALLAQYYGVNGVYHVVMPDVQVFNAELERRRVDIEKLASSESPLEYYRQHIDLFEPIMFPSLDRYVVIKIPLIPYPNNVLRKVFRLLGVDSLEADRTGLPSDVLEGLAAAGLVRISSKGIVRPLDEGRRLHQILAKTGIA